MVDGPDHLVILWEWQESKLGCFEVQLQNWLPSVWLKSLPPSIVDDWCAQYYEDDSPCPHAYVSQLPIFTRRHTHSVHLTVAMTPLIPDIAGAATMHSQHSANSHPSSLTPRYFEKQKYSFSYMHRPVRWTSSATELNLATPIIQIQSGLWKIQEENVVVLIWLASQR